MRSLPGDAGPLRLRYLQPPQVTGNAQRQTAMATLPAAACRAGRETAPVSSRFTCSPSDGNRVTSPVQVVAGGHAGIRGAAEDGDRHRLARLAPMDVNV